MTEQLATYRTKSDAARATPREQVEQVLKGMKASATFDDIIYEAYLLREIEKGEADFREGRVLSHENVKKLLARWLQ